MNEDRNAKVIDQRDRIEALEAALREIVQWSDAYPITGSCRHVTEYAGKIARAALDKDTGK